MNYKIDENLTRLIEMLIAAEYFLVESVDIEKIKVVKNNLSAEQYNDFLAVQTKLKKREDELKNNFLIFNSDFSSSSALIVKAYAILSEQEDTYSLRKFYKYLKTVREEDFLMLTQESTSKENLITELANNEEITAEMKWHYTQSILNMQEQLKETAEVLLFLEEVTENVWKKYKIERDKYVNENRVLELLKSLDGDYVGLKESLEDNEKNWLIVVSPIYLMFMFLKFKEREDILIILSTSIKHEVLIERLEGDEEFFERLKLLSDETRYNILKSVINSDIKNKDLAEQLNITSAAVSFHIKKLQVSLLLVGDMDKGEVRYKVNKQLIKNMIRKLEEDFL